MNNRPNVLDQREQASHPFRKSRRGTDKDSYRSVAPQDDWKKMTDSAEKKRAQNRIAQRNYRQNVKRRIEELERQVETQADLLALQETPAKSWQVGTGSLGPNVVTDHVFSNNHRQSQENQKALITPISFEPDRFDLAEPGTKPDALRSVLHDCQGQGAAGMQKEHTYGNLDLQPFTTDAKSEKLASRREAKNGAQPILGGTQREGGLDKIRRRPASPMQFSDLEIGIFDHMNMLHTSDTSFPNSSDHSRRQDSVSSWSNFDNDDIQSPKPQDEKAAPRITEPGSGASLEERVGYLIRCAQAAEFEDLDSAIMTYYTAKFDEGSACSSAQRLSRKRTLPKLLERLRSEAESWRSWEAQAYQDEIFNSAESLYLAEIRSFSGRQGERLNAFSSSSPDGDWNSMHRTFQEEVPNLWSLVTSLCLESANQSRPQHHPRLVLTVFVLLLMVYKHPPSQVHEVLQRVMSS